MLSAPISTTDLILRAKLEQLGLTSIEAQVYLAIRRAGPISATAIAREVGSNRTTIYPVLGSLADKGLIEGWARYRSKFAAASPQKALGGLIARQKQLVSAREQIAAELAQMLTPVAAGS